MSKYSKIAKNAENFMIDEMYANMKPNEIKNAIKLAVNTERERIYKEYQKLLDKTVKECNEKIKENTCQAIDTISIELLYELANQMDYWNMKEDTDEEKYIRDSVKYRIQEVYQNTIDSVIKYSKMKNSKQATKEFKKKYNKIQKEFDIKI